MWTILFISFCVFIVMLFGIAVFHLLEEDDFDSYISYYDDKED